MTPTIKIEYSHKNFENSEKHIKVIKITYNSII